MHKLSYERNIFDACHAIAYSIVRLFAKQRFALHFGCERKSRNAHIDRSRHLRVLDRNNRNYETKQNDRRNRKTFKADYEKIIRKNVGRSRKLHTFKHYCKLARHGLDCDSSRHKRHGGTRQIKRRIRTNDAIRACIDKFADYTHDGVVAQGVAKVRKPRGNFFADFAFNRRFVDNRHTSRKNIREKMSVAVYIIPVFLIAVFIFAIIKKVNIYSAFIEGAKQAIPLCTSLFPYLFAVFVMVQLFETSGLSGIFLKILSPVFKLFSIPPELTNLILLKPFSGSGSLASLTEIFNKYGVDSYISICASCIFGSSETVFFVASTYFSKCKKPKTFKAVIISLAATFCSAVFACFISRFFV